MKFLVINPNTTATITDRVVAAAAALAPGVQFVGATGRFGARYIASRAAYAIAGHAALDAWANAEGPFDAIVLACFGDPGLDALREVSSCPVVGMADASLNAAMHVARRFSIVTGGERWQSMLRDFTMLQGIADRVASIRTIAPTGATIAGAPDAAIALLRETCRQCVEEDGAEAVVLGGAGLINLSAQLRHGCRVPIIDSLEAAIAIAIAMASIVPATEQSAVSASDKRIECVGLSDKLTVALGQQAGK